MNSTKQELHDALRDAVEELKFTAEVWHAGETTLESTTHIYAAAQSYRQMASCAVLLGDVTQARQWFTAAAQHRMACIDAERQRRDFRHRGRWEREPRAFNRAFVDALLGQERETLERIATEAMAMPEVYLEEFETEYLDAAAAYFEAKTTAAVVLDGERVARFSGRLSDEAQAMPEKSTYLQAVSAFYRAVVGDDAAKVDDALVTLVEYCDDETPEPETPWEYVHHVPAALTVLARTEGLSVSPTTERVPDELVDVGNPTDAQPLDINLTDSEVTSRVGAFELERDGEGVAIAARMYHPGGAPVTLEDVPDRPAGRLLSDAWVEAALDEADWRDAYDNDVVTAARDAYEAGTLQRTLVVVQDRADGHTFDESLSELPVDDIEMLKAAGRR